MRIPSSSSPALVVAALASLASLDPAQGPPLTPLQLLPGDGALGPAAGDQEDPALAPGGGMVLAVWEDHRTDLAVNLIGDEGGADIFAARLDAAGQPLDPTPLAVSVAAGDQTAPRVAWNGTDWLVVWTSQVPTQSYWTTAIHAARVSPAGTLLDSVPIQVVAFASSSNAELFGVASDGASWLVAWKDFAGTSWVVQGARVSAQGVLLDPVPVPLHTAFQSQPYNGDLAFATDEYLVVWNEWRSATLDDVFGRRLSPALAPLGGQITIAALTDYDVRPRTATDGTSFFVVWEDYNTCCVGGGGKVYGARVDHAGRVLDPRGIAIASYGSVTIGRQPAAAWDGSGWMASWTDDRASWTDLQILAARVSSAGVVLDPSGIALAPMAARQELSAAATLPGGGTLVAWVDSRAGGFSPRDVYAAPVDPLGRPGSARCAALAAPAQVQPKLAATGAGYLAVLVSAVSGAQRLLGQRLDRFGMPLDLVPFEIQGLTPGLRSPAVAWDGARFLVAWEDWSTTRILAKRVDAAGNVLDPAALVIQAGETPAVAAESGTFVVVATHAPSNPQLRYPFAVRVRSADGAVLDPTPRQLGQSFARSPQVTAIAGRWIAAWHRHFSHNDPHADIRAAFVNLDGTSGSEMVVAGGYSFLHTAAVASDGAQALVAWCTQSQSSLRADLSGRLVSASGTMLAPFPISTAPSSQWATALAFDGARYVAGFQDLRNAAWFVDLRSDLYGARIDATGSVLDPAGFPVAVGTLSEIDPAVAGSGGSAALAGAHFRAAPPFASYRVGVRVASPPACAGTLAAYGTGCPGSGGFVLALTAGGCPAPGNALALGVSSGLGGAVAALGFGLGQVAVPLPGGCTLWTDLGLPFTPLLTLGGQGPGAGSADLILTLPPGTSGAAFTTQAFALDAGVPQGFTASGGIAVRLQ